MNLDINQKLDELLSMKYETETVEFKEAKDNFSFDDLGKYFSALSNEANLHNGWIKFPNINRYWMKRLHSFAVKN
ncbi:hypothetical protein J5690_06105 [bacterium]|nr:hypothetical protein [bacterium]